MASVFLFYFMVKNKNVSLILYFFYWQLYIYKYNKLRDQSFLPIEIHYLLIDEKTHGIEMPFLPTA